MNDNFKKYKIHVKIPDGFDHKNEDFINMVSSIDELINNTLDDEVTVVVVRIPDTYNLQVTEESLHLAMMLLRDVFDKRLPNTYLLGIQFDVECVNKPDKIVMWPDILDIIIPSDEIDLEDESQVEAHQQRIADGINKMIEKLNAPKIIVPGIIT